MQQHIKCSMCNDLWIFNVIYLIQFLSLQPLPDLLWIAKVVSFYFRFTESVIFCFWIPFSMINVTAAGLRPQCGKHITCLKYTIQFPIMCFACNKLPITFDFVFDSII